MGNNKKKETIVVDTRNQSIYHPEIQQLESLGFSLYKAALPVGDYVIMSKEYTEILQTRHVEAFCKHLYKDKDIAIVSSRIDFAGTYHKAVDTKTSIVELYLNLVLIADRYRFERELLRARNLGIDLLVLITDQDYRSKEDIITFESPFGYKDAGIQTLERMEQLEKEYPVQFGFLGEGEKAGKKIVDFLLDGTSSANGK